MNKIIDLVSTQSLEEMIISCQKTIDMANQAIADRKRRAYNHNVTISMTYIQEAREYLESHGYTFDISPSSTKGNVCLFIEAPKFMMKYGRLIGCTIHTLDRSIAEYCMDELEVTNLEEWHNQRNPDEQIPEMKPMELLEKYPLFEKVLRKNEGI